jgi:hypothetical protein
MIKTFPLLISYALSCFIWYQLDKKFFIVKKINKTLNEKIKISKKNYFYVISSIILNVVLILLLSSMPNSLDILYSILFGFILSTGLVLDLLK